MKKIQLLCKPYKAAIIVSLLTVVSFAATSFLFTSRMDVPLGLLVGGVIIVILNVLQGIAEKNDEKKSGTAFSLAIVALKFVIFVTLLIISALMFYRWNLPYLNIFSIVGIYTASILTTIVIYLLDKE